MKTKGNIAAIVGIALAATLSLSRAQTPGSIVAVAGQVNGTVTVASTSPGGCPTLVCTTNLVTSSHCFTNWYWKLVCTTNATGRISCTNVLVSDVRCYTNTYPEITCSNVFLTPPASIRVSETLSGAISAGACNELGAFPSNAVFQASLSLNLRTNDWVGSQNGVFKIVAGTNVLVIGSMTGISGLSTPLPDGPCAVCNGFQGTLRGTVSLPGPLHGAEIEAGYAGVLSGVTCPSANVPAGAVQMVVDGVAILPCFHGFSTGPWIGNASAPTAPSPTVAQ
jgi:hypothetical protein